MERFYKIADLTVKMNPKGTLERRAEKYICENGGNCDFVLNSSWDRVKIHHPDLDDDTGEYISMGFNFYKKLLVYDGIMLHSSAVVVDGKAYLFSADSGVGKSTHTKLWLELLGDRAYILNDDKPAVRLINGTWYAYGTPWSGKHDISRNLGVPVAGICLLERAENNSIESCGGAYALKRLIKQLNRPKAHEDCEKFLWLLESLVDSVPIWKLECNTKPDSALISYNAMTGTQNVTDNSK